MSELLQKWNEGAVEEARKQTAMWQARALKAEADAKGWEEMHDKAAKSRDENLAARLKAEEALREILDTWNSVDLNQHQSHVQMARIARAALSEKGGMM